MSGPQNASDGGKVWLYLSRVVTAAQLAVWLYTLARNPVMDDTIAILAWVLPAPMSAVAFFALQDATRRAERRASGIEATVFATASWLSFLPATTSSGPPWPVVVMACWTPAVLVSAAFLARQPLGTRQEVRRSYGAAAGAAWLVWCLVVVLVAMASLLLDDGEDVAERIDTEPGVESTVGDDLGATVEDPETDNGDIDVSSEATATPAPVAGQGGGGDSGPDEDGVSADPTSPRGASSGSGPDRAAVCAFDIGGVVPEDPVAALIRRAFEELVSGLADWILCGDAPVQTVAPGWFRQEVRSAIAGPTGWLIGYYGADGELEVDFIPPQVGQVHRLQAALADWTASGFPHTSSPCGGGRVQIFWDEQGLVSGYALWSYDPEPGDKEAMSSWFVPAPIARSIIDAATATGRSLPLALGPATGDGTASQGFGSGFGPVEGSTGPVHASEILSLCPSA